MYIIQIDKNKKRDQYIGIVYYGEKKGKIVFLPHNNFELFKKYIVTDYIEKERIIIAKNVINYDDHIVIEYEFNGDVYKNLKYEDHIFTSIIYKRIDDICRHIAGYFIKNQIEEINEEILKNVIENVEFADLLPYDVLTEISNKAIDRSKEYFKNYRINKELQNIIEQISISNPEKLIKEIKKIYPDSEIECNIENTKLDIEVWLGYSNRFVYKVPIERFVDLVYEKSDGVYISFEGYERKIYVCDFYNIIYMKRRDIETINNYFAQRMREFKSKWLPMIEKWRRPIVYFNYHIEDRKYKDVTYYQSGVWDDDYYYHEYTKKHYVINIQLEGDEMQSIDIPYDEIGRVDKNIIVDRQIRHISKEAIDELNNMIIPEEMKEELRREVEDLFI